MSNRARHELSENGFRSAGDGSAHQERLASLDGVRGAAALMVAAGHGVTGQSDTIFGGEAQMGVMLFFVLSGFLMGYLYLARPFSMDVWVDYAVRRIFRVFPLFAVMLSLGALAWAVFAWELYDYPISVSQWWGAITLREYVSVFWTVSVEMKFYVVFPVLCAMLWLLPSSGGRAAILAVGVGLAVFAPTPVPLIHLRGAIDFFLIGVLVSLFYLNRKVWLAWAPEKAWDTVLLIGLVLLVLSTPTFFLQIFYPDWDKPYPLAHVFFPWGHTAFYAPLAGMIVLAAAFDGRLARLIFANPPACFLGRISYSLYLCHMPVLFGLSFLSVPAPVKSVLYFVLAVLASWTTYCVIERPARRFGYALSSKITKLGQDGR
ncbi:MAG: acyltransferase [Pseudomonadota bacterium]